MSSIQMLDCTLREAPIENLMWGDFSIKKTIGGLEKAHIDIIEVGFLKDEEYVCGSTSFKHVEEIKPYITHKKTGVLYVALIDYGRYSLENLSSYDGTSIDAIRICFKHDEIGNVLETARKVREKGYLVCIQHVDTMGYTDEEIVEFIERVNEFKPFSYSVVDTFGAMYQNDLLHYVELADKYLLEDIKLGFHGHNNLMLADANAQCFIEKMGYRRDVIVDSSLFGCGRGAGNAHTELIAQYINTYSGGKYIVDEVLDIIDTVITAVQEKTSWGYSIPYFIAGMHNAHTFNVKQLLKRHNLKSKDLRGIIERLDEKQKKTYDYALLEQLYVDYFENSYNDKGNIDKLTRLFANRKILVLGPGMSVKNQKFNIEEFIRKNEPVIIAVNNIIDGYKLDFIFFSGALRYQNLQYQDYQVAGNPNLIVTSNIKTEEDGNEIIVNYTSLLKYGWINLDSSAILLIRLLLKCKVNEIYIAGVDGYREFGEAFYKNELDTGLDNVDRIEHTKENIEMLKDIKANNTKLCIHFLTDSVYKEVFD